MSSVDLTRWSEIRARFDEIVDLPSTQREEQLAQIGKHDPELRNALASLLSADALADEQLQSLDEFGASDLLQALPDSMSAADPLQLAGHTISHFRIIEPIASGGMGVVYRAEDLSLSRVVALKIPLPYQAVDAVARERFVREARAAGALDHPNLCTIHEAGESDGGHLFLAMPFYAGETLRGRLARSAPLPLEQALEIARQITDGLACAHDAGMVHRDLKPGNVMLLPDGTVKILDFGLAKFSDLSVTKTASLLGTAAYMAPEQIKGGAVDGRADLWALGVVLYEMLAGERPFSGENELSMAHAIVHDEPRRPALMRSDIAREVENVILTLLHKSPAQRYPNAQVLAADIAAIQRGARPSFAQQARRRARLWLRTRGRRAIVARFVLAFTIIAATVAFGAQLGLPSFQRKPTSSAEAYDLFQRAQEYETRVWAAHEWNHEWLNAAETLYRRALAFDPEFALARAQLANVLATRQYDVSRRSAAGLEQVRREAEAALRSQPNLGEAHLALSFYWDMRGDNDRVLAELELARKASPGNAEVHGSLGWAYMQRGRWDDAVAAHLRAQKLDGRRAVNLARAYVRLRRYELAVKAYDQYLALAPDDYGAMLFRGYVFVRWQGTTDSLSAVLRRVPRNWDPTGLATLARLTVARRERRPDQALAALAASRHNFYNGYEPHSLIRATVLSEAGDTMRALSEYESARVALVDSVAAHVDDARWRIPLAKALAGLGRNEEALREAEQALALARPAQNAEIETEIMAGSAAVFAALRENDRALDLLQRLLRNPAAGLHATGPFLRGDPTWDPLRGDSRFRQLLRQ